MATFAGHPETSEVRASTPKSASDFTVKRQDMQLFHVAVSLIALDLQPNICLSSRSLRTCGIHSLGPKPEAFQNESATCTNTAPKTHKTDLFERKATLKTLHKRGENQSTRCMGFCANREK